MKRFHIHVQVRDLAASVAFYSRLFAAEPTRVESDYAKWMLDDPRINFAISTRGARAGVDHLGIQVETAEELGALKAAAQSAEFDLQDDGETTCCYARSDKHWIVDPDGLPWEHFHTLQNIPVFNEQEAAVESAQGGQGSACCAPQPAAAVPVWRGAAVITKKCC